MGTVTEDSKHGHIYLQQDVSGQFDKVLATSQHSSVDTFLEHLFELYTKASKTTQTVAVRNDVAQRFTALQCETRFQTSDDLMKHLLSLHVQYLKTASNDTAKQTRAPSVPRKRKSQPKRNFKHTALIDSEEESDEHLTSSCYEKPWRELSISSVEEAEVSLAEGSKVDLSRVKQEVVEADDVTKNRTSGKAFIIKRIFHKDTTEERTTRKRQTTSVGNYRRTSRSTPECPVRTSKYTHRVVPKTDRTSKHTLNVVSENTSETSNHALKTIPDSYAGTSTHIAKHNPESIDGSPKGTPDINREVIAESPESSKYIHARSRGVPRGAVSGKRKTDGVSDNENIASRTVPLNSRKIKKIMHNAESEVEDDGLEKDLSSLYEEARVACINIENVEGNKFEFFAGDEDVFKNLVADAGETYQDIDDVHRIALERERLRRNTKHVRNSQNVPYNYDCFKCGKRFRNRAPLNLHIAAEHNEDGAIGMMCSDCGKQVDYDHELHLHKQFFCKKVKKNFRCMVCKLFFITELEKAEHPCTKDTVKPYYCSVQGCQMHSRNVKDLTEHVTRHLGIKPFLCNACGRAFSAKKDMDRHADIHRESKDYSCQVCNQTFKSYHTMRRHVFVHKFKDRFKCDQCPYTTAIRNSFSQHMIKHTQRTHKCQICDKNLRSSRSLAKHIQNRHTFNRIFTCRYCEFKTDVGLSYSSHMRHHRGLNDVDSATKDKSSVEIPLGLLDHGQSASQINSLSSDLNLQKLTATKLHSNVSLRVSTTPLWHRSVAPMLADAAIPDQEEIAISGQNIDAIMANIVESSGASEIAVISSEAAHTNLVLYSIDVPSTSLNVPSFISDTITAVTETETWANGDGN